MPVEIRKKPNPDMMVALRGLTRNEVLVGVPAENAGREPEPGEERPLNNAEIGYVQEFGSTIEGPNGQAFAIPPRPHLIPGIEDARDNLAKALGRGVRGTLQGDKDAADKALHTAGLIGQNAVRNKITEGPFVPLAPMTIAKRKARGRTGTKPLIDTGAYRNAQTYVVRPKGED
ncbi:hypothetical protein V5F49_20510 [Xanthobacter sp. V3C-3]|uniref:hypothetical protein n=1 Tax=Xanthobacter lutulentifluminis TaxID=3119935 RepID=UPI0037278B06